MEGTIVWTTKGKEFVECKKFSIQVPKMVIVVQSIPEKVARLKFPTDLLKTDFKMLQTNATMKKLFIIGTNPIHGKSFNIKMSFSKDFTSWCLIDT